MSTLHEEQTTSRDSEEENEFDSRVKGQNQDETHKKTANCESQNEGNPNKISSSHSLNELQAKQSTVTTGSPSIVSSGYGSQAASSSNLSSEDSLSIKSISVDETPETETNNVTCDIEVAMAMTQPQSLQLDSLLSPPDVSLQSISPGKFGKEYFILVDLREGFKKNFKKLWKIPY